MIAATHVVGRPHPPGPATARTATSVRSRSVTGERHASADAWDASQGELDRHFRDEGRATDDVRSAARRIAAEMLAVGASASDVRDALRRSVHHHALEVALDAQGWAVSGGHGASFLGDVLQCVTSREQAPQHR